MVRDEFERILDAFRKDFREQDVDPAELDKTYSSVLGRGLVSEAEIEDSFAKVLTRSVQWDHDTGIVSLKPEEFETLGDCVRAFLSKSNRTVATAAKEFCVPRVMVEKMVGSEERLDWERLVERLSESGSLGDLSPPRIRRFVQAIRVFATLRTESDSGLRVARK